MWLQHECLRSRDPSATGTGTKVVTGDEAGIVGNFYSTVNAGHSPTRSVSHIQSILNNNSMEKNMDKKMFKLTKRK